MRHDAGVIKALASLYGTDVAREFQNVPFFLVPISVEAEFTQGVPGHDGYKTPQEAYRLNPSDPTQVESVLPFKRLTMMDTHKAWVSVEYLGKAKRGSKPGTEWLYTLAMDDTIASHFDLPVGLLVIHRITLQMGENQQTRGESDIVVLSPLHNTHRKQVAQFRAALDQDNYGERLLENAAGFLQYALAYFKWAETKHLVQVKKKPTKQDLKSERHGDKKPWARGDKPHYIYLDGPSENREHEQLPEHQRHGTPKRGHARRAHWRALKHPRFRHHPLYGQKIRVKEAWVGPREWSVADTIYTVQGDSKPDAALLC